MFRYTLIAFDERATFLASTRQVTALCVCVSRRLVYNHYAIAHACNAANAQGSDRAVEAKKITLSLKAIRV